LGVLTWGPGPPIALGSGVTRDVIGAAVRGHEMVILDLGRAPGQLGRELVARCSRLIVVTPATVTGLWATSRLLAGLGDLAQDVELALRRGSVEASEVESVTGRRVATLLREQRGLSEALDLGLGPAPSRRSPLARAARELLAAA
jgi:hypothetical protein